MAQHGRDRQTTGEEARVLLARPGAARERSEQHHAPAFFAARAAAAAPRSSVPSAE